MSAGPEMRSDSGAPNAEFGGVERHACDAASLLKALASDRRLLVLCALIEGPLSVGEINERVPLSQSALSQHLAVLREAGIVTTTRQAQSITYELVPGPALEVMQALYRAFCAPQEAEIRRKTSRTR